MRDSGTEILPGTGRGTSRRLVEGLLRPFQLRAIPSTALRAVPSPFRGGSEA